MSMEESLEEFYKSCAYCSECVQEEKRFCPEHSCEWNGWAKHYYEYLTQKQEESQVTERGNGN